MKRFVVIAMLAIGFITSSVRAIDGTPVWFPSVVTNALPMRTISTPTLAFDHYGGAAVSWSRIDSLSQNNTVHYSEQSPLGLWSHRTVSTGSAIGTATSVSFDRAERPSVGWLSLSGNFNIDINHGATTQLISSNAMGDEGLLVFNHDLAGQLQGAYAGANERSVYGINTSTQTITSNLLFDLANVDKIQDLDITIDHAGRRHAIVTARLLDFSEAVFVASEPSFGGAWATAMLDSGDAFGGASIAVNPQDGSLAVAYSKVDDNGLASLVYQDFSGPAPVMTDILSGNDREFGDIDLEFDPGDGRPSIALEESISGGNDQLLFAYNTGGTSWATSLVDDSIMIDTSNGEARPSLAYDDFGSTYPAIAYIDDDGALIVSFDPPIPEPATAMMLVMAAGISMRRQR